MVFLLFHICHYMKVMYKNLEKIEGAEAHSTYIVPRNDLEVFNNLRINLTSESELY